MFSEIENHLAEIYGLTVISIETIQHGVANANFLVVAETGNFVFKVYQKRSSAYVSQEVLILNYLARARFNSPRIMQSLRSNWFELYSHQPAIVYHFIDGSPVKGVTPADSRRIGELLGQLHDVLQECKATVTRFSREPEDIRRLITSETTKIIDKGFPNAREIIAYIDSEMRRIDFPHNLPRGLTHQDVKPDNIIEDDAGRLHVIDFDNAYYGTLLYDVMTTVIWLCFEDYRLRTDLLAGLLEGYESKRCLSELEIEHVDDALRFRLLREAFDWPRQYIDSYAVKQCEYFMGLYNRLDTGGVSIREYWHNPGGWNGDASRL